MNSKYAKLDIEIVQFFENFILKKLNTHSFIRISPADHIQNNMWCDFYCNICNKDLDDIVGEDYMKNSAGTLTCNEMLIKNILE